MPSPSIVFISIHIHTGQVLFSAIPVSLGDFKISTVFLFTESTDIKCFSLRKKKIHIEEKTIFLFYKIWQIKSMLQCSSVFCRQKLLKKLCGQVYCPITTIKPFYTAVVVHCDSFTYHYQNSI